MNNWSTYFYTDWAAMTVQDWIGMILTLVIFFLMIGLYVYVLRPRHRERFESQRFIPLEDVDQPKRGEQNGGT